MRRHFHRCGHLRVLSVDASELSHARKGGTQILEELCSARGLARCLGLVECDILSPAEKRELLSARVTRLREEEGGYSTLAEAGDPRAAELAALRADLLEERAAIAEENRRRVLDSGGALQRHPRPISLTEERELAGIGVSSFLDAEIAELRVARLDAIDFALDAMARGRLGDCARCGKPIDVARLREAPDSGVCIACASEALPEA